MRGARIRTTGIVMCLLAAPACGSSGTDEGQSDVDFLLEIAKSSTSQYTDVLDAIKDGYGVSVNCVESAGAGSMGLHYTKHDLYLQPPILTQPATLLYAPGEGGKPQLGGIEYTSAIYKDGVPYVSDTPPTPPYSPSEPPVLFPGHPFNGPMQGHAPRDPWHYDQHVWIYIPNPNGMFAPLNPNVHCPPATP
jgi:hypothetical protein